MEGLKPLVALLLGITLLAGCHANTPEIGSADAQSPPAYHANSGPFIPNRQPFSPQAAGGLRVPTGFRIGIFASGLGNPRMMAVHHGIVYVTRPDADDVMALSDRNGDGQAEVKQTAASRLNKVHGIAFKDNTVYLATPTTVYKADVKPDGTFGPTRQMASLPPGRRHPYRTVGFGPDGTLYVSVGSTCNACKERSPESATILTLDNQGHKTVFAKGLRNTIGFGWQPQTRQLWGMDIGTDWRGPDLPPEELNHLIAGGDYGWPWCYGRQKPDGHIRSPVKGQSLSDYCVQTQPAVMTYQAHSSPIAMVFYQGTQFPASYQGDAFVALHGSWNRKPAVGYKVVRVNFDAGQPVAINDFMTGFLAPNGRSFIGRPAGVAVDETGALLVSDDNNGVIYRITASPSPS